jgi:hypothetical protein
VVIVFLPCLAVHANRHRRSDRGTQDYVPRTLILLGF